jgi:cytochrome c biogenesis protein CcmG, thiol:disulfide interchange protein DsbE
VPCNNYGCNVQHEHSQPIPRREKAQGLRPREIITTALLGLLGLVVIAVVWSLAGRTDAGPLPAVAEVNRPAPAFNLPAFGGGELRLEDYRGKVVLVNFWGTWCEPCKAETPDLQRAYEQLQAQGLVIIGVNLWNQEGSGAEQKVRTFVDEFGVSYPIALDTNGAVAQDYRLYPIPTSYFIDPQGQRVDRKRNRDVVQALAANRRRAVA